MKLRSDFITNSSSTSYMITNKTDEDLTLVDFVKENPELICYFVGKYDWYMGDPLYTQECLLKSAEENNILFPSNKVSYCVFGDESGTLIGQVFDYILRCGGESKSFIWKFYKYLR